MDSVEVLEGICKKNLKGSYHNSQSDSVEIPGLVLKFLKMFYENL